MNRARLSLASVLLVLISLIDGCASTPILARNSKYKAVGRDVAERDVQDCTVRAKNYVSMDADTARNIAGGVSFVPSAGKSDDITVNETDASDENVGGGFGGAAGVGSTAPEQAEVEHLYVNQCLAKRGYEVLGWS